MTTPAWDAEIAQRVGRSVKALREAETPKVSAAKLAERTSRFGYALTKAQISDLELGRKKTVTVPELIVLAAALGRPPLELLYPALPHGEVDIWPGIGTQSLVAAQWFSGEIPASKVVRIPMTEGSNNDLISAAREYDQLSESVAQDAKKVLDVLEFRDDDLPEGEKKELLKDVRHRLFETLKETRKGLEALKEGIRASGGVVNDG
ncbi:MULTISPECIES: helix-turn-helix domain-containing protein [Nocardia]|nr:MULTISPECIES: helix-turn-helix transcriptional regulator [Nocardia]